MTDDPKRPCSSLAVWLASAIVLLVAYVLSAGPVKWLLVHGYLPAETNYLYHPIGTLANHCNTFEQTLHWYLALWAVPI
jgi:hypothetical protein